MKRYIFDVKYIDPIAKTAVGRKAAITGVSYLQAWIGCLYYMENFLSGDFCHVDEIGLVTIEEL